MMVYASITKAKKVVGFLRRTFRTVKTQMCLPSNYAMERRHFEYCVQTWAPSLIRDIAKMEKVQFDPGVRCNNNTKTILLVIRVTHTCAIG